jgi:hypothetical protein
MWKIFAVKATSSRGKLPAHSCNQLKSYIVVNSRSPEASIFLAYSHCFLIHNIIYTKAPTKQKGKKCFLDAPKIMSSGEYSLLYARVWNRRSPWNKHSPPPKNLTSEFSFIFTSNKVLSFFIFFSLTVFKNE